MLSSPVYASFVSSFSFLIIADVNNECRVIMYIMDVVIILQLCALTGMCL